jgi:tRNA pseudouridine38-40 synthase
LLSKILDEKIRVEGSSRTDAYVHAIEHVFSFKTKNTSLKPSKLLSILNLTKPSDIKFISIKKVNDKFHARFSSKFKIYEYVINLGKENVFNNNYVYNYQYPIKLPLLKKVSKLFIGQHDFRSFSRSELENTIRTIQYIKFKKHDDKLIISIKGDGFLRNMVRMIIGSLLDVNENKKNIQDINKLLINPIKGSAISKAPARGLYLKKVIY